MENSDKEEIERLRRIIAKLEKLTGTRVITTEITSRGDGKAGFLVYVTAPTAADEVQFGMAMYSAVVNGLKLKPIGTQGETDFIDTTQVATPEKHPALNVELYGWVGRDEMGSGEIGLKQGVCPAGVIPMISIEREKIEKYWPQAEDQASAYGQQISLVRFRAAEIVKQTGGQA